MPYIRWLMMTTLGIMGLSSLSAEPSVGPPQPLLPVPTSSQLAWQRMETNLFVHFTVNTFTDREWGDGTEPESVFNPAKLDARQWARAARAGGFKMIILTAKHHDGFCLWPSRWTAHTVANSPWKGGKGDVVAELAQACREEGLKLGLYLSPWDRHEPSYGDSSRYNHFYRNQLIELLTRYGTISEVWFDGACGEGPNGKRQEYDWDSYISIIRRLQPEAVVFSDSGPDVRWIGNESGTAGDPNWAPVDPAKVPHPGFSGPESRDALQHGSPDGTVWRPGECDVSIRPGWFWHASEDAKVRSVDNLVDLYFHSVGRNAVMLLNVPANRDGLLSQVDVDRLKSFRARLDAIFRKDIARSRKASASSVRGGSAAYGAGKAVDNDATTYWATDDGITSGWLEVDLGKPGAFNVCSIKEHIPLGQRVQRWRLEYLDGEAWKTAVSGTTIGCRKLDRFPTVTACRVRLSIEQSRACPAIESFSLFHDSTR